jgi:hypothetical protein
MASVIHQKAIKTATAVVFHATELIVSGEGKIKMMTKKKRPR